MIAIYRELDENDYAYQRACLWWMRLAQLAFITLWSWTLAAWMLLLYLASL